MGNLPTTHQQDVALLKSVIQGGPRRFKKMSPAEVRQYDGAHRRVAILLSQVRTRLRDPDMVAFLNGLLARSHALMVGAGARSTAGGGFWNSLLDPARVVARTYKFHLVAAALFFFGALMAFAAVMADPMAAYAIMPDDETRLPGAGREHLEKSLRYGRDQDQGDKLVFASFLVSNNTRVGLMCMASGAAAGVPTVFLTIYNGMILGAFTATHALVGIHGEYWAWILPHGVPEIWALVLMSGMGLRLGSAMIAPGRQTRRQALLVAGGEVVVVTVCAALMLVAAAIIESYVRQSHMSTLGRFWVVIGGFGFLSLYFGAGAALERRDARLARLGLGPDRGVAGTSQNN